jgi:molecular chaperone Hsp33
VGETIDSNGIRSCGGLLVQVLPRAAREPALVALLEERCSEIRDFSQRLQRCGEDLRDLLEAVFPDLDPVIDAEQACQSVTFHCPCTRRRSLAALKLLGREQLTEMMQKDGGAELTCHFCNETYQVSVSELEELIGELEAA